MDLLTTINTLIAKYGGPTRLALYIEHEMTSTHKCFKSNCAYCSYFAHPVIEYTCELPDVLIVLTDIVRTENIGIKYSNSENDLLLKLKNAETKQLLHLFPHRTLMGLKQHRNKLYRSHLTKRRNAPS